MIIAIDFDETLHAKSVPVPGRRMGEPLEGAKAALEYFQSRGDHIIILTVMATTPSGIQTVIGWMDYYGIPFEEVTAIKPNADIFIDDRAIRHVNWKDTLEAVNEIRMVKNQSR